MVSVFIIVIFVFYRRDIVTSACLGLCSRKSYTFPTGGIFSWTPHPSGNTNSAWSSYISSKFSVFQNPPPLGNSIPFHGGSMDIFWNSTWWLSYCYSSEKVMIQCCLSLSWWHPLFFIIRLQDFLIFYKESDCILLSGLRANSRWPLWIDCVSKNNLSISRFQLLLFVMCRLQTVVSLLYLAATHFYVENHWYS